MQPHRDMYAGDNYKELGYYTCRSTGTNSGREIRIRAIFCRYSKEVVIVRQQFNLGHIAKEEIRLPHQIAKELLNIEQDVLAELVAETFKPKEE